MCGITGILALDKDQAADTHLLAQMTELIRHRGPDDAGYLCVRDSAVSSYSAADSTPEIRKRFPLLDQSVKPRLGLGFRRLAILDLSESGHQPMSDPQLGLHLVFNGEIYNYIELREELKQAGYAFQTQTDTEVILKAYHAWGADCLSRFNGIWAFAIWDARDSSLFCSRDRFGVKPFYYCVHEGMLYFGSELKQLLATQVDKSLNYPMLWRSMKINALQVYGAETFWSAIKALEAGHSLIVRDGKIALQRHHHLDQAMFETSKLSLPDAVARYRELFERAVRWQMRSDVEVGACLSGGLDSSAIVGIASRQTGRPMQTFSAWFDGVPELDERNWIQEVALASGSSSHLISPDAEDADKWFNEVTWFNDLPPGSPFTAQYSVMRLAQRQGIKVLLDGQGSDELTGGYRHAQYRHYADLIRSGRAGISLAELRAYLKGSKTGERLSKLGKIFLSTILSEPYLYQQEFKYLRFDPFNAEFQSQARAAQSSPILDKISRTGGGKLSNFLYNMIYSTSLPTLLHWEDRMSMAASIESRVPFLDHELVEFAFSLPSHFKIKGGQGKFIHRQAMRDIVPPSIFARKAKSVFGSPFTQLWLRGGLRKRVDSMLHSSEFRSRGIWDLPGIKIQWDRYLRGDDRPAQMIYNIYALETWFRLWTRPDGYSFARQSENYHPGGFA